MNHDWRVALRSLRNRPGLTVTVVLTLAIGIGANAAIFSAIDAVLLKPLPYPDADRLVKLYELNLGQRGATQLVAPVRIDEWGRASKSFEAIAASYFENMTDTTSGTPERVEVMRTAPRFFEVLGVSPALGRLPAAEEEVFGGPAVAVISDTLWRERFRADPSVVGRVWNFGGATRVIVGVMPPWMRYPTATTEAWLPVQASATLMRARQARFYTAIARLKPGVTEAQARAELNAIQARLGEQFPETDKGWGAEIVALKEEKVAGIRRSLWFLFAAVGLVLVAACGNVGCLMLADASRREHEVAVRLAIGARRSQIVGQLLREGVLLSAAGAALALVLAYWASRVLSATATGLPGDNPIGVDIRIVGFALVLGVLATLMFALAPALQASRRQPIDALARGGRGSVGGRQLLQRLLVGAQVALAIVLLVGAGLLIRSFARLQGVSSGIDASTVLTFRMTAQWTERVDAVVQRHARTLNRLEAIPGVHAAAFSANLPIVTDYPPAEFTIVGQERGERTFSHMRSVSAGYFATLGIPLIEGNTCSATSTTPNQYKAVVTREFATRYFPDRPAIGQILTGPGVTGGAEIVGVTADVRERGLARAPEPIIYFCGYSGYWPDPYFFVRLDRARPASVAEIRAALRELEPGRAMYVVRPLDGLIAQSLAQPRLNTILLGLFAAMALALAAMGLYGVLTQLVAARTREIGVRIALGAAPGRIVRSIAGQAAGVTAIGIVCGLAGAVALARFMSTLVFDIPVRDPVTFTIVPLVLAAVAAVAALVPARRASRVDPVDALRN
jgi:putative ABC transport system permease protein